MKRILLALLPLAALAATNAGPTLEFQSDRVQVRGLTTGERVAWAAMLREPVGHIERIRVIRGVGTVGSDGELSIPRDDIDPSRSVWLLSALDREGPERALRITPNGDADPVEIPVTFTPTSITVQSAAIDVTYIQPNGDKYYFFGADGSNIDADDDQNGSIVISLAELLVDSVDPNPNPNQPAHPTSIQSGGVIVMFDVYEWRKGQVVVP